MGTVSRDPDPRVKRWRWYGRYQEKHIPHGARWRWEPNGAYWWTGRLEDARKLIRYADSELQAELREDATDDAELSSEELHAEAEQLEAERRAAEFYKKAEEDSAVSDAAAIERSHAVSGDMYVPAPPGMTYLPFQLAGVEYCLNTKTGNALIADDMGLGKTIEAMGIINRLPDVRTVLVICPASVKRNWAREAVAWMVRPLNLKVWSGRDTPVNYPPLGSMLNFHIANYDILNRKIDLWLMFRPDVLILDESHYIKNAQTKRAKAVKKLHKTAIRTIALTGTPITNRPVELYTTLSMLDPHNWHNKKEFVRDFCGGPWTDKGASNLDELQARLRSTLMVRRRKEDVLTELPSKRRQIIELDPSKYAHVLLREKAATKSGEKTVAQLRARLATLDRDTQRKEYEAAVSKLRQEYQVAFNELSRVRHETAVAKISDVIDFIANALTSEQKVLVFAHHRDVIDALESAFMREGVVTLTGSHSLDQRQYAIDSFQNDRDTRLFIGSTTAAGIGITLTAASTVIFAELDWVPANLTQAEDRTHRIGQRHSVSVYHLVVDGSLDAKMAKLLVHKQLIIDQALDPDPDDAVSPFDLYDKED